MSINEKENKTEEQIEENNDKEQELNSNSEEGSKKEDKNKEEHGSENESFLNDKNTDELKEMIKNLENENKKLKKELSQTNDNWHNDKLKNQADLDNFQKRIQKEKDNYLKYSSMNLISNLLVPLEQLEQVVEMQYVEPVLKNFLSGFKMINKQIKDILNKEGVQEIKALGEKFDPKVHHAIEKVFDKDQPNEINIAVLQKGFLYKDLVIKPAMVKVNEWSEKEENENK
ncbi:nucleotide exchange factor GrpE ['Camptotheca acuminata' phytoplasma]|uniref:nucleotide exchange factor GrpE n=1 Tax='Camptotheca acuminata' phytoplasma TaxID=3239192 RepID=UPI00351A6C77